MAPIRMTRTSSRRLKTIGKLLITIIGVGYFLLMISLPNKSNEIYQVPKRRQRNITIWSNDFHISTIQDTQHQLSSFNIEFITKSLSEHCHLTKTCAKNLKILNRTNGISPSIEVRQKFYEVYKNDPEMNRVDAFLCFHPTAMCEVFMPFNRPLIIIASTRYEMGRFSPEEWIKWNKNLIIISLNPRNVVAANNLYDAEYIRYFTGVKPIVLPSLCDYTGASYVPKYEKPFLIAAIYVKDFRLSFISNLTNSLRNSNASATVGYLREVYKEHYSYAELASHPGMIYVPYQVSLMSLFEQYRMNIPLFFPSLNLLTEWHYIHHVLDERTWDSVYKHPSNTSKIPGVLGSNVPDPNNEFDQNAIRYWLQFSDFYQWPHIIYYDSIDDLAIKLTTTNLTAISKNMNVYNTDLKRNLSKQWHEILQRIDSD